MNSSKGVNIIKNLLVKPARVDTADIGTWKDALRSFTTGDGAKLYDLYDNLMADPFLYDAVQKRTEAVTNAEITFQLNGKNVEEMDDLMDTPEFELLLAEICRSEAYGRSVIEAGFAPAFWTYSFPRQHIRTINMTMPLQNRRRIITAQRGQTDGYDYAGDPYIIDVGRDSDPGYIFKAAQYVIYKRGGFGDWAQFVEIFGMPFVEAKYDGQDIQQRDQVFDALDKVGSRPIIVTPQGAEIKIHDNKSTGSAELFDTFRRACNEEILIAVLGNTMTTVNGSSRSQAEVHQQEQQQKAQSDRRMVQRVLNRYFVPLLAQRGYRIDGGFFSFPDQGENMSTDQRVDLALKLRNNGIPVANNYFYEITGIPAAEESPAPESPTPKIPDPDPKGEGGDDGEEAEDPTLHDGVHSNPSPNGKNSRLSSIFRFFGFAPTLRSGANQNPGWRARLKAALTGRVALADDYSIDINKLVERAIRGIYDSASGNAEPYDAAALVNRDLFHITNTPLQTVIDREMLYARDDEFMQQLRINTAVFAAFKNHRQTAEMVSLLVDEDGNLRSFAQFKKLALQVSHRYNVEWLRTEYNTAVRAARQAANFKRYESSASMYPNLEYMHTLASMPREEHLAFVGTVLPVSHPWWKRYLPPNGWNCQCWVQNTDKEITPVPDDELEIDPVFLNNPAYSAELFPVAETAYYKNTPDDLRQSVEQTGKKYQKIFERESRKERYEGKNGGYLQIVQQKKNEYEKNLRTYTFLADRGGQYTLLPATGEGKNPDAFNYKAGWFSDAKHPETTDGSKAIQNSIKNASSQKVSEVVIHLDRDFPSSDLYVGFQRALQEGRAMSIRSIILIRKDREPVYFDAEKLREHFKKKKRQPK